MDDKRLERIEIKIDDLGDHLASIDTTLGAQHVSLREHIKRSDMLERRVDDIEKKSYMAQGALKLLSILAILATLIDVIVKFK